jgi:chitin disaccharide deacetylase
MLFVNADDLGSTKETTDRILTCYYQQRIHAASAMLFMKDSERAAGLAKESGLPVGLHLNLIQDFTGELIPSNLRESHRSVVAYLNARKINQVIYNPSLSNAFDYTFQAQWNEYYRLYGEEPKRLDGHKHMHLCMNMIASRRYPKGMKIRRNFTFSFVEKNPFNRLYRYLVDCRLRSQFICTDFFFSLAPIDEGKLKRLVLLSKSADVELMVHPGVEKEYLFLLSSDWANLISEKN